MQKLVVIDTCDECPHFDNEYWGYDEKCILLDRKIELDYDSVIFNSKRQIPLDCPLKDYKGE